jgi:hypothetical protein
MHITRPRQTNDDADRDAIQKLRKAGVSVETQYEQHGGEFACHHGRYILRSRIVRLDVEAPAESVGHRSISSAASTGSLHG